MKTIFEHPRLGKVTLSRSRALKRISVSVRPSGEVRLNVPWRCSVRSAVEFLEQKEEWIGDARLCVAERYAPDRVIVPPFSTHSHHLEFVQGAAREAGYAIVGDALRVTVPCGSVPESPEVQAVVRRGLTETLRLEAREVLPPLTRALARQYGFSIGKVTVRASKLRWGSCAANNNISLSIYLMLLPEHLIRHVILHELCHTRHKDHSTAFHVLLDTLCDGREAQLRRELLTYNTFWL